MIKCIVLIVGFVFILLRANVRYLTYRKKLIRAIRAYHQDCHRYGGEIFVTIDDIYILWKGLLCSIVRKPKKLMPEAKFAIIESYL